MLRPAHANRSPGSKRRGKSSTSGRVGAALPDCRADDRVRRPPCTSIVRSASWPAAPARPAMRGRRSRLAGDRQQVSRTLRASIGLHLPALGQEVVVALNSPASRRWLRGNRRSRESQVDPAGDLVEFLARQLHVLVPVFQQLHQSAAWPRRRSRAAASAGPTAGEIQLTSGVGVRPRRRLPGRLGTGAGQRQVGVAPAAFGRRCRRSPRPAG